MPSSSAPSSWRNDVTASGSGRLSQLFLRYAQPFAGLRRIPVFGSAVGWLSAKLVPRDTLTWIQVQHGPAAGLWMRVNPRTGRAVLSGSVELPVQQALLQHLRPGMTFYDLGANIGFFTLLAAKLVGPPGRVVSFEADPEIAARLRENVSRNKLSFVRLEQLAVWSEPGTVSFSRVDPSRSPDRGQGHISLRSGGFTPPSSSRAGESLDPFPSSNLITVNAVSLDAYAANNPAPDFIKCDVEGAEVAVFRGACRLFAEKRPVFLCEMHSGENRRILLHELSALGYRCLDCDATHVLALPQ